MFEEIMNPLFSTDWGRRTSWGMMVGLSLLTIYLFVSSLSTWYSDSVITHVKSAMPSQTTTNDEVAKLIAQLPEQHVFGKMGAQDQILPITSLQLRLMGIIKSDTEKKSRVIISEKGQVGKVYHMGDSLPSGVRIHSIARDGVVLENSGRLENLPLPRSLLSFKGVPKSLLSEQAQRE